MKHLGPLLPPPRRLARLFFLAFSVSSAAVLAAACGDDTGGSGATTGSGGASGTATGSGGATATSSSTGQGAGDPCEGIPVGCFDAATCYADPPVGVSFEADVLPVLVRSCSLSASCHGNPASPRTSSGYRPYLGGTASAPSDIPAIFAAIVGVESSIDPQKSVVEAGSWEVSTFMNKVDGALDDCADLDCPGDCGRLMPQGLSKPLPLAERNLMRAWIAEGAQQN